MLQSAQRAVFDDLLETVLTELPDHLHQLLEELPLVVEDIPSPAVLRDLEPDGDVDGSGLCGLHWGIALTDRNIEHSGTIPDQMMIFREPILRMVGDGSVKRGLDRRSELTRQIRITVLHEIGHHFGLDEGDLEALGYG